MTPPVTLEERYGALAASGNSTPCLASTILGSITRRAGFQTYIIDAAAEGLIETEVLSRLEEMGPDLIGFTTTTLTTLPAERLAQKIKEGWPDIQIGIGGPHATAIPEETIRRCPHFDFAAIHEGDETILDILHTMEEGNHDFSSIAGIVCRNQDGEIVKTAPRPPFTDLDSLPFPAWDLLPGFPHAYSPGFFKVAQVPSTSFVSSRGCPFTCSFCDTSVFGQKIRSHSADYMVELFAYLYGRFGIRDVTFEDDTFMVYRKNVEAFCDLLLKRGLGMTWACNSRVNLAKPDLLKTMKDAGCWHISYGIESGSQDILDHEDKKLKLSQIHEGIEHTRKAGIAAKGFFIVGHPRETQETLEATYRLTQDVPFSDISVTCMTPFPGSPLSKVAHEYGAFEDDWTKMNLLTPVFIPSGLTADDIQFWQKKILRAFYFRPKTVFDYTRRVLRNPSPRYIKGIVQSAGALAKTVFSKGKAHKTVKDMNVAGSC
jgi:anaerobic magnesium-protoporphyrin IX monomethyl ester cyclase